LNKKLYILKSVYIGKITKKDHLHEVDGQMSAPTYFPGRLPSKYLRHGLFASAAGGR